jgi:hypothetical protein
MCKILYVKEPIADHPSQPVQEHGAAGVLAEIAEPLLQGDAGERELQNFVSFV